MLETIYIYTCIYIYRYTLICICKCKCKCICIRIRTYNVHNMHIYTYIHTYNICMYIASMANVLAKFYQRHWLSSHDVKGWDVSPTDSGNPSTDSGESYESPEIK